MLLWGSGATAQGGRSIVISRRERGTAQSERPVSTETRTARRRMLLACLVLAAVVFPFTTNSYWLFIASTGLVTAVVALSFNVLVGLAGLPSFAQAAFMGIGAYTTLHLVRTGVPFPLTLLLAGLVTAAPAVLVVLPGLRLKGVSLGILTLGAAVVADGLVFSWRWFTGGVLAGAVVPPPKIGPLTLGGEHALYVITATTFAVGAVTVSALRRGSTGRALLALRSSEPGALASGLSTDLLKLEAFAIGGFFAGVGGSLFAYALSSLSTVSFNFVVSLNLIVIAIVGGVYEPLGALAAGLLFSFAPALLAKGHFDPNLVFVLTGAGLVGALMAGKGGIAHAVASALRAPQRPLLLRRCSGADPAAARPSTPAVVRGQPEDESATALSLSGVSKRFGGITAVSNVSLDVEQGQMVALIGPNGAGKTTLMRLINGLVTPDAGDVRLGSLSIGGLSPVARARAGLGWTYQSTQLFGELTTLENLLVPLERHRPVDLLADLLPNPGHRSARRERLDRACSALEEAGLTRYGDELTANLPFGVLRRLEVARAVVTEPKVLLLDEPATGMNASETDDFGTFLSQVRETYGLTMLFIEHDMSMVMSLAERVFVLDFGELIAEGTPEQVRSDPKVVQIYLGA